MAELAITYVLVTLYIHFAKVLWLSRNLPFRAEVKFGIINFIP